MGVRGGAEDELAEVLGADRVLVVDALVLLGVAVLVLLVVAVLVLLVLGAPFLLIVTVVRAKVTTRLPEVRLSSCLWRSRGCGKS